MKTKDLKVSVIGTGNMGEALIGGMIRSGITRNNLIVVFDANAERMQKVVKDFELCAASGNEEAVRDASVVLLAVKPQNLPAIKEELHGKLKPGQLVISILAGIPVSKLQAAFGQGPTIVRVMPNLPALIGQGMSVVADDTGEPEQIELAMSILETVGDVIALPEKHLDAVTAMAGSGPGYVYLFIEAMAQAGAGVGLPPEASRKMAQKTFIGACRLLECSDEQPEELRRRVTSPGGTTEAGVKAFEELGLREIFQKALKRSTERAEELGRG